MQFVQVLCIFALDANTINLNILQILRNKRFFHFLNFAEFNFSILAQNLDNIFCDEQ